MRTRILSATALLVLITLALPAATQESSVNQGDWARMLTSTLGWDKALGGAGTPAQHIWLLTGRDKISVAADQGQQSAQDAKATTWTYEIEVKDSGSVGSKGTLEDGSKSYPLEKASRALSVSSGSGRTV